MNTNRNVIARREEPVPLEQTHFSVPGCTAVFLGVTVGLATFFGLISLDIYTKDAGMTFKFQVAFSFFVGFLTMALTMIAWWLKAHAQDLLFKIEEVTGIDINQDGVIGAPQVVTRTPVRIDNNRLVYISLPASEDQLDVFFRRTLRDGKASERGWKGHFVDVTGKDRLKDVWDELKGTGLMVDGGPGQPLKLTPLGYEYMRLQTPLPALRHAIEEYEEE